MHNWEYNGIAVQYSESIAVKIVTLDTLLLCTYRPPDSSYDEFAETIKVCQEAINMTMKEDTKVRNILHFGDFNFPSAHHNLEHRSTIA